MTERCPDENGWLSSANAWIDRMGEEGDFARKYILDHLMIPRILNEKPANMLDIGCGEGRFCRVIGEQNVEVTGIDPVDSFINHAKSRDPRGNYQCCFAESLPFADESFDLVVFYLSLIDITDLQAAIREATRVLRPNGRVLIANLTSFTTSNGTTGSVIGRDGKVYYPLGSYLEERANWFEWGGLRIRNWHRPLSTYISSLLDAGLVLTYFDEPKPIGGPHDSVEKYNKVPFVMMMEWKKPL
ncbi:methyltransferase domain-containing protein [Kiloniella laminariae]|uniref:methyltransferase domain-containing protein n=1 Tax=Kiloniella laminariae TaxID=454162 RepID=UPI0003A13BCD